MRNFHVILALYILKTCASYTFTSRKTSYIQYEQWDASETGVLKFKFKTYSSYGMLLYADNSKSSNSVESFIAVKLNYGKVSLTVQMGSEDYKSKKSETIGNNLHDLKWHDIEIRRLGRETKLILDSTDEIVLINDGEYDNLELNSGIFFGGLSNQMLSAVVDKSIKAIPRFIGCVENIKFKSGTEEFTDKKIEASEGAQEGCLNACVNVSCANEGKCVNRFTTARCDCIGTGYHGENCTQVSDALHFKGEEYVTIKVSGPLISTRENNIKLRFKTTHPNGVIFAAYSGRDHLMLEIHSNTIRLSMDLGGGSHIMEVNTISFSDGEWHLVEIFRKGRDVQLLVDRTHEVKSQTRGVFSQFDLRDLLYMGGHPKLSALNEIDSKSQKNFNGCLQHVYYNNLDIVYKVLNVRSSQFKIYGDVKKGCPVEKPKTKNTRGNPDSNISVSGPVGPDNTVEAPKENVYTSEPGVVKPEKVTKDDSTLSKQTVILIAVGLIVGFIVLIVTLALIVHNIRNRYSGVFISSHYKENINPTQKKRGALETVMYTPRNGHLKMEPHLV